MVPLPTLEPEKKPGAISAGLPEMACDSSENSKLRATALGLQCRSREMLRVDVDHDGLGDCIVWLRCGTDVVSELADGGLAYPVDSLMLTLARGGGSWELYTNGATAQAERLEDVRPIRFGTNDQRLVIRATGYGTGNIQIWAVVDVFRGAPRRWLEPPLDAAVTPLLHAGERVGKHYEEGIQVNRGTLDVARLVYGAGDPNCCPSGGIIRVRLSAGANALRVDTAWRERGQ